MPLDRCPWYIAGPIHGALIVAVRATVNEPVGALLALPSDLETCPGHVSGSVRGAGLSGKPTSTLAFEKGWTSILSLDRQAFIDAVSDVPPQPVEMERILAFNRGDEIAGTRA